MLAIRTAMMLAVTATMFAGTAYAQSQPAHAPVPATAGKTCANQYKDAQGVTPAKLLRDGFEIRAGWPGGLWLQKSKDAYFCNSGRVLEGAVLCWTMQEPVNGATCQ
jgi:hypothetical protein